MELQRRAAQAQGNVPAHPSSSLSLRMGIYDQLSHELNLGNQQVDFVSKSGAGQTLECSQFRGNLKHKTCFGSSMNTKKTTTKILKPNQQPSDDTGTLVPPRLGGRAWHGGSA